MRITAKTTLAIGLTISILTASIYGLLSYYLTQRFGELEIDSGYQNLQRYDEAVLAEEGRLYETAADYGGWDDAYNYVQHPNDEFIRSNFLVENFVSLKLDLAIISDQKGDILFSRHANLETEEDDPVPQELLDQVKKPQSIFRFTEPQQKKVGLFFTQHAVFLVAAAPIITSDKKGPVLGTMLMARHLDTAYASALGDRVRLPVSGYEVDVSRGETALFKPVPADPFAMYKIEDSGAASYRGSLLLKDVFGQPVLIVRAELPRIYSQQALDSVRFVVLLLSAFDLVLILLLMLLMQRLVISRIKAMASRVRLMSSGGKVERLRLPGKDEVSALSGDVVDAFDALEKSRQAIKESEKRFAMLSAASQDGIFMSSNGKIVETNETASKITGYTHEELKGMSLLNLVAPESREKAKTNIAQAISKPYEVTLLRKNGEEYPSVVSGSTLKYGNRKIRISSLRDMSDIKRAEADLRESEKRFKTLSNATLEGVLIIEGDKIEDFNETAVRMTGFSGNDLIGKTVMDLVAPEDRKKVLDHIALSQEAPYEVSGLKKSGERYPLYISGHTEYRQGKPFRIKILRDITEQKKTEQALRDWNEKIRSEREKLDVILHSIADAVVVISRDGKVQLINSVAADLCDLNLFETIGHEFHGLLRFKSQTSDKELDFIDQALEKGEIHAPTGKTLMVKKDGSQLPVAESAAPIKDSEGHITGCVLVFRDATKEREIDQMKTEFVSVASHQLRSPLSGIKWLIELVLNDTGKLKPDQREYLEEIDTSNERMIQLVEDLLDVSRIETGRKFTIEKKDFDVIPVLDDLLKEMARLSQQKQVSVSVAGSMPKSLLINADQEKIREVFKNLISNAIKYTLKDGHVTVGYAHNGEEDVFSVKDDGIGIPQAEQKKIFEKFFRAGNVARVDAEGTGLGLYIAKAIVEGHGGKIWFESKEGRGTTFFFSLRNSSGQPKKSAAAVNRKSI